MFYLIQYTEKLSFQNVINIKIINEMFDIFLLC